MIALGRQRPDGLTYHEGKEFTVSGTTINQLDQPKHGRECKVWLSTLKDDYSADGVGVLDEKDLKRLGIENPDTDKLLERFGLNSLDEVLAAVGHGDITTTQIANTLQDLSQQRHREFSPRPASASADGKGIRIHGVGDLMTQLAKCCKPVPSDPIVGYITRGRGVTIHRQDCANALRLTQQEIARMIDVSWSGATEQTYPVDIAVFAYDRQGLLRDVSTVVANEKVNVIAMSSLVDRELQTGTMQLTVEVSDLAQLSRLLDRLVQLPNVFDAKRQR